MNDLKIIDEREVLGKSFRAYGDFENPLFLAKDVASWIEHSNSRTMLNSIDNQEKTKRLYPVNNPYGGYQEEEQWFLTEDGLYEVLMQSRKPIAKQFKKEVKAILKDIRKYGAYATDKLLDDPDLLIGALQLLKAEREEKKKLEVEVAIKNQMIEKLKPQADYTNLILRSHSLVTITQIAKDYGMGGSAMNKLLHELKIIYKQGKQWFLYADYHSFGYTHSETIHFSHKDGTPDTKMHTKWTQKGRLFLYEKLKSIGVLPMIERKDIA